MDYKREGHVWGIRSLRSFSLVDKEWNGGGGCGGGGGGVGESKLFSRIKRLVNIREAFYSSVKLTLLYPCYSKGKDGDPGTPGTPGKDGEMGLQGERGAAGTHGIRGATVKFSPFVL